MPEHVTAPPHAPALEAGGATPDAPTVLEVLRRLGTGTRGLTETEAAERLAHSGANTVPDRHGPSWPRLVARGLRDPFTAVLLCAGAASALVAWWGTACVVLVLVAVGVGLRAYGEQRADRSMTALRDLVVSTATVLRRDSAGTAPVEREIPVEELVPGDVIRLGPGDLVPADVRLLRAYGLSVHQAVLTGESSPAPKDASDTADASRTPDTARDDGLLAPQLCFQGSSVASGSGTAVVVATGARTRLAAAHGLLAARREPGAFDRCVHGVSWALVRLMLLVPPLVLLADAALRGRGLATLPFAIAVAVGLVPEMLPVVVTTCLARGAGALARTRGVLVRRLPALHDLGAVDVLCLDKTGTLTRDRPVVERALDGRGREDPEVLHWAAVNAWWTLQLADLPTPDALDEAVLDAAGEDGPAAYEGVAAVPFDPVRRLSVAVVRTPGRLGTHTVAVKGAVETVLERCALTTEERERLLVAAARQAGRGLRVLAVAAAERPVRLRAPSPAETRGLTFVGFVTLRDTVTDTAADALAALADRGVTVRVVTGDHPGTAVRACRDLGIPVSAGGVLTADRVDAMSDGELAEAAGRVTVFARCAPGHKARIAAALRAGGHTVGFLGDGVNDLPALRVADVGIAPRDAVPVVRETADVVLAGKDLGAVGHAIEEGRRSSGNITTYLCVSLSSNLGNVVAMLVAGVLLPFLPMLPSQVLVQNLCFDAAQLAFAHDRPHPGVLRRPTVVRARGLLRFVTGFGALNAVADLATFAVLALTLHGTGSLGDEALFHSGWFTENLVTQALVMVLLRAGGNAARGGMPGPVGRAAVALAAAGVLLPLSPLGPPLGLTALPPLFYALLVVVLALYAAALAVLRARRAGAGGEPRAAA
ncbi:magnesium-translocating P-type ATPase [Streptomyces sp. NPDC047108]|uniref:magnesium-translocating P-type ATPase n=1 Tax=Streptomyces sp. NPDC047108 TaxID=3155025 RepID=UPI0033CDC1A8